MARASFRAAAAAGTAVVLLAATAVSAAHAPPVVTEPSAGAVVGARPARIAGTAAGDVIAVRVVRGAQVLAETGTIDGAWRVDVDLADGSHTVSAQGRDGSGSWSALSAPVTFTVDTVAPAAPVITAPANGSMLAFADFAIEGTAEPRARVEVTVDTGGVFTTTAAHDGTWRIARTWSNATHTAEARAFDAAGNRSLASAPVSFTVDTFPPAAPRIDTPSEGFLTNAVTLVVSGGAEPGSTVEISEHGPLATVIANGVGGWSVTLTFAEGPHLLQARARDAAGNLGPIATRRFTIDRTPPAAPIIGSPTEGSIIPVGAATITGTAEPEALVQLLRGAAVIAQTTAKNDGTWTIPLPNPVDGTVSVSARARDLAGNVGPASPLRTFQIDATRPTVEILTANGTIFTPFNLPQIEGTAEDERGVHSIVLDFYDVTGRGIASRRTSCAMCPGGTRVTWMGRDTPLVGRFVVRAYALDLVGNRSLHDEIAVVIVRAS